MHLSNSELREVETTVTVHYKGLIIISNSFPIIKGYWKDTVFNGVIPNVGSTGEIEFPDAATNVTTSWNRRTDYLPIIAKEALSLKIPPMTRLTAMLSVSTAIYEVPFSYQQIDELPYGGTQTQHLHDGVFKIESEYGVELSYSDIRPLTLEVLDDDDDNIYTDFRALDLEGLNLQDDGIEAKASDEGLNVQDDGIEPKASDEVNQEL
ncbi:uncharacterized protein LOC141610544 isoform X2 [Silene latifolia]|uniref:uncharacterized protein LOC141610544 isoform X2 n=1 Tax=Silene latifolia TaxID=37657 RepID=UPI003D76C815